MVKLVWEIEELTSDVIGYGTVSYQMTFSRENVWRAMRPSFLGQLTAGCKWMTCAFEEKADYMMRTRRSLTVQPEGGGKGAGHALRRIPFLCALAPTVILLVEPVLCSCTVGHITACDSRHDIDIHLIHRRLGPKSDRRENNSHPCAQRTLHPFCVVFHACMVAEPVFLELGY